MKRINYLLVVIAAMSFTVACQNNVNYKKTKSGLLYKIFSGGGKDSLIKMGQIAKFQFVYKFNDSVIYTSYDKMPGYAKIQESPTPTYDLREILPLMKNGDSAVTVQLADTLMKQAGQGQLPPNTKKGDRFITTVRVIKVFTVDSIAMADISKEREKDMPRQLKEQEAQAAKRQKEEAEMQAKEIEKLEASGEVAKETKELESWLAAKKINAQKTGKGTYVSIQQQGTGPTAEIGKYVSVKYAGKVLATDSVFQSSVYSFKLGTEVIGGWTEGLQLFKQGGKGILYIPGFLAYGPNPGPAGKPYAALIFDVELLEVSDKPIAQQQPQQREQ
jgi:FKBP-type peptidyl-prolyl cis-trans isomerase FkpA